MIYCCLLSQCEALRTCRSGFPIATKWCCDQDVEVVPGAAFTKKRAIGAVRCKKEWMLLQALWWHALIVWFTTNGMCAKNNIAYMWHEQAIIEWSWRVISIVACCHSAKFCAYAPWDIRSQQHQSPPPGSVPVLNATKAGSSLQNDNQKSKRVRD